MYNEKCGLGDEKILACPPLNGGQGVKDVK